MLYFRQRTKLSLLAHKMYAGSRLITDNIWNGESGIAQTITF